MQRSPLHRAAEKGHTDVMKALIEAKADINSKDKVSNLALEFNRILILCFDTQCAKNY